jgi:hypothetical protein
MALNSSRTQYNNIEFVHTIKILGINFDKKGIAKENIGNAMEKIEKSMTLWHNLKLNMIEKISVCKIFLLSKICYIANFTIFDEEIIKKLERIN